MKIGPANDDRTTNEEINGVKYIFKANDPYGFITITCLKINKTLEGTFTSISEARKAATAHSNKLNKEKN